MGPMRALVTLVSVAVGLSVFSAWLLHLLDRWVIRFSISLEVAIRKALFTSYFNDAQTLGIAAQKAFLKDADSSWIPQVREGVFVWYRTFHRYLIQGLACLAIACCIHPLLTLLTAIAFLFLWRVYRLVDRRQKRNQPILSERSHSAINQVFGLAMQSTQLASLYPKSVIEERLDGYLRSFRDAETRLRYSFVVRSPVLTGVIAIVAGIFLVAIGVHILKPDPSIDATAAMTLIALICAGLFAIVKVVRCCRRVRLSEVVAGRLISRLHQDLSVATGGGSVSAARLANLFELNHVSIEDANGHQLLCDLQLQAKPGSIIAIVGSRKEEVLLMTELVFGLGQPTHGQILWDNRSLSALESKSLSELRAWIDPHGPLMAGTLFENLSPTKLNRPVSELVDATRKAGVYEAINELQETFSTFMSPDDDRLKGDALFRIGVARAILKQPSLVVAIEPSIMHDSDQNLDLVNGLRALANQGAVVFVVPRHGATLRNADQVVLLHDHKMLAVGKHPELLEKYELYRHINYLLFSPFKQVVGADV